MPTWKDLRLQTSRYEESEERNSESHSRKAQKTVQFRIERLCSGTASGKKPRKTLSLEPRCVLNWRNGHLGSTWADVRVVAKLAWRSCRVLPPPAHFDKADKASTADSWSGICHPRGRSRREPSLQSGGECSEARHDGGGMIFVYSLTLAFGFVNRARRSGRRRSFTSLCPQIWLSKRQITRIPGLNLTQKLSYRNAKSHCG